MEIKRYVVLGKRRIFGLGKTTLFQKSAFLEIVPNLCLMAGHTFNVLRFMAGHLMRSETSRVSRETFSFSWNLSYFAETFRFSRSFSAFSKLLVFLLINGRPLNEKRDFSVFLWNLSFLVKPFVIRKNLSFLAKLLVFSWNLSFLGKSLRFPSLINGRPSFAYK